ncbi:MAG TPA: hypothetical protein VHJ20_00075 [Polyangia bacterium]|nr:hypothetical protein [Polyangia bacterium]
MVEVAIREEGGWVDLPPKPWPNFVRLSGSASDSDIALLLAVASSYGRGEELTAATPNALFEKFPHVLPGGIAVVASDRSIFPSCCCGLETWPEWTKVVKTGASPWMGHDPSPLVEVVEDGVRVWTDGAMGDKPAGEQPVVFSRAAFAAALDRAIEDLEGFVPLLRRWLGLHAPDRAKGLTAKFKSTFLQPERRE